MSDHISPEILNDLVRYEPMTGLLYWRRRSPHHFSSETPAVHCQSWNSRLAGKQTFKRKTSNGSLSGRIFHYTVLASRAAFCLHWGRWPLGVIEHWDGDKTNNTIYNLRDVDSRVAASTIRVGPEQNPVGPDPKALWGLHYSYEAYKKDAPQEGHRVNANKTPMGVVRPDSEDSPLPSGLLFAGA